MNKVKVEKFILEGMDVKDPIDPTGCGNTFCGGFLVGWYKTRNLLTAALWGSVSASFSKLLTSGLRFLCELFFFTILFAWVVFLVKCSQFVHNLCLCWCQNGTHSE